MSTSPAKEAMLRGDRYRADDPVILADQARAAALVARFNRADHDAHAERATILRELCVEVGEGVEVRPPFRAEYGHVRLGDGAFLNVDCVLLAVGTPARVVRAVRPQDRPTG